MSLHNQKEREKMSITMVGCIVTGIPIVLAIILFLIDIDQCDNYFQIEKWMDGNIKNFRYFEVIC